ncbi:MAG: signal peptidase I [Desulfovibrio sp.]|jgi:signal peptidase I|nr:signal peptidase I [Desulfovibrio sp.]
MAESGLYQTPWQHLLEIVKIIAAAVVIMLLIRTFLFEPFIIPSNSMLSTLQPGDRIFVAKFSYGIHLPLAQKEILSLGEPGRGDIIVFPYPRNPRIDYIKRVVGLPGDVLEIREKQLYRNGEAVQEDYISHSSSQVIPGWRDFMRPVSVPPGKLFVMGDNRDDSQDSRYWGFVDKDTVHGRAVIIYWSSLNFINISWSRIGTLL